MLYFSTNVRMLSKKNLAVFADGSVGRVFDNHELFVLSGVEMVAEYH